MNYEEVGFVDLNEIKRLLEIKEEVDKLMNDFKTLDIPMCCWSYGKFIVWSDANNECYITVVCSSIVFHCRFLNNSYDLNVNHAEIFNAIKNGEDVIKHFKGFVSTGFSAKPRRIKCLDASCKNGIIDDGDIQIPCKTCRKNGDI